MPRFGSLNPLSWVPNLHWPLHSTCFSGYGCLAFLHLAAWAKSWPKPRKDMRIPSWAVWGHPYDQNEMFSTSQQTDVESLSTWRNPYFDCVCLYPNDGETQICHESSRSLLYFTFHLFEGLPHTHILAEHNCLSSQQIHQGDLSSNVKDKEMPVAAWRKLRDICWRKTLRCYGNPEI